MYGFDESTQEGGGKYISTTGIVKELKISKLEVVNNGSTVYLEVEVKNKAGQTAGRRYYEPVIGSNGAKDEDDLKLKQARIGKICKNICMQYLPSTYAIPAQASFEAFLNKMVSDIGNKIGTKEVKAVLLYNTHGFTTLRSFSPLFESMDVEDNATSFNLLDFEVKSLVKDEPKTQAELEFKTTTKNDNLPF